MKRILVSGANAIMGYGILKSLRMSKTPYYLIGTTIYDYYDSVAPKYCDEVLKAPLTLSEGFVDWLLNVVDQHNVDLIIPSFEIDVAFWATNFHKLEGSKARLALNNPELILLCQDKWEFYKKLEKEDCPYAIPSSLSNDFNQLSEQFGLPFLVKPRHGSGSKGIAKINNIKEFDRHKNDIGKKLLVQKLVGKDDEEFTTGAFCDGNGGYTAIITFRRKLSNQGFTNQAEVVYNTAIKQAVSDICKILKPKGPTNFQFRVHNDVCQLLEINPRFSASTSFRSAFGYNEAIMAVEYFLDDKMPSQPEIKRGRAVRYIEDFIFYS